VIYSIQKGGRKLEKLNTSDRLKEIMKIRNLRQVDILEMAKPYCEKHNIKMNKSDISQYVSGLVEPGQEKLSILGMALNVSEVWLMGYNVSMDRDTVMEQDSSDKKYNLEINKSYQESLLSYFGRLNSKGMSEAIKRVEELTYIPTYCKKTPDYLIVNAAHDIKGATDEEKQHDDDIMNDENF
jgi:transcriptional regulator with XRE-family HTH domain